MKSFTLNPLTSCFGTNCQNDKSKSFWLSTPNKPESVPTKCESIEIFYKEIHLISLACDLKEFVGRCSVCEIQANFLALHSQTDEVKHT